MEALSQKQTNKNQEQLTENSNVDNANQQIMGDFNEQQYRDTNSDLYYEYIDNQEMKKIIEEDDKFQEKISDLSDLAGLKISNGQQKEGLHLLQQAEKILEFAASCGKIIDRALIIIVLYNTASVYQSTWILDKCQKYLDAVIYNLQQSLEEEEDQEQTAQLYLNPNESAAYKIKMSTFLVKCYLQQCAVLSQMGQHQKSMDSAKLCISLLQDIFEYSYFYVQRYYKSNNQVNQSSNFKTSRSNFQSTHEKAQQQSKAEPEQAEKRVFIKEEIFFFKPLFEYANQVLPEIILLLQKINVVQNQDYFQQTRKQLYFWQKNVDNNEKYLRQLFDAPVKLEEQDVRNLLGIQSGLEWIQNFNIGTIMHISPISFEDFVFFGDMTYQISKNQMLEKIIYLSICYFTLATEIRFLEIEELNLQKKSGQQINEQQGQRKSEFYHLKAIEIACKFIMCKSPYIDHLVQSYHKHYFNSLQTIEEEENKSGNKLGDSMTNEDEISKSNEKSNQKLPKKTNFSPKQEQIKSQKEEGKEKSQLNIVCSQSIDMALEHEQKLSSNKKVQQSQNEKQNEKEQVCNVITKSQKHCAITKSKEQLVNGINGNQFNCINTIQNNFMINGAQLLDVMNGQQQTQKKNVNKKIAIKDQRQYLSPQTSDFKKAPSHSSHKIDKNLDKLFQLFQEQQQLLLANKYKSPSKPKSATTQNTKKKPATKDLKSQSSKVSNLLIAQYKKLSSNLRSDQIQLQQSTKETKNQKLLKSIVSQPNLQAHGCHLHHQKVPPQQQSSMQQPSFQLQPQTQSQSQSQTQQSNNNQNKLVSSKSNKQLTERVSPKSATQTTTCLKSEQLKELMTLIGRSQYNQNIQQMVRSLQKNQLSPSYAYNSNHNNINNKFFQDHYSVSKNPLSILKSMKKFKQMHTQMCNSTLQTQVQNQTDENVLDENAAKWFRSSSIDQNVGKSKSLQKKSKKNFKKDKLKMNKKYNTKTTTTNNSGNKSNDAKVNANNTNNKEASDQDNQINVNNNNNENVNSNSEQTKNSPENEKQ